MKAFDSSRFFSDPFFFESVSVDGEPISALVEDGPAEAAGGGLASKVGAWLKISIKTADLAPLSKGATISARGADWIVEDVADSGDVNAYECLKSGSQRRK